MDLDDLRAELETDLAWRLDEIRHLRNDLLGELDIPAWPVSAMRAILIMQYAHLEGYAKTAFSLYVTAINARQLTSSEIKPSLFATACTAEFDSLHQPSDIHESEDGRLTRRAKRQVEFVERIRQLHASVIRIDTESATSMDMNFGSDVLRRTFYRLGISETEINDKYYSALEFVRRTRNDIAHGGHKKLINPKVFDEHKRKSEQFMRDLARIITTAVAEEHFRVR